MIRTTVHCDGPKCVNTITLPVGHNITNDLIIDAGFEVQEWTQRASLDGSLIVWTKHFCTEQCQEDYRTQRRMSTMREYTRR